ncbi:MAG: M23 family metallopeptidase [Thermaerobacterales bacterium]
MDEQKQSGRGRRIARAESRGRGAGDGASNFEAGPHLWGWLRRGVASTAGRLRRVGPDRGWRAWLSGRQGRALVSLAVAGSLLAGFWLWSRDTEESPGDRPADPSRIVEVGPTQPGSDGEDETAAENNGEAAPVTGGSVGPDPSEQAAPPRSDNLTWPVAGRVLSGYGWNFSDTMQDWRYNAGIDIAAEEGTQVRAVYDGTVIDVRLDRAMGWTVEVEHAPGYRSLYASNERVLVETGTAVQKGEVIAWVGSSALVKRGQGPLLHFRLTWDDERVDPLTVLTDSASTVK